MDQYEAAEMALSQTISNYDIDAVLAQIYGKEWAYTDSNWQCQFNVLHDLLRPAKKWAFGEGRRLKVLDVGCGIGNDTERFVQHGFDYVGIDKSQSSITTARHFNYELKELYGHHHAFRKMDVRDLKFRSGYFDGAWCVLSLNHLEPTQTDFLEFGLMEMARVMKRSAYGLIIIEEGKPGTSHSPCDGLITSYLHSAQEFNDLLHDAGFETLSCVSYPDKRKFKAPNMTGWLEYFVRRDKGLE